MKRREEILHRINLIKLFVEAAVTFPGPISVSPDHKMLNICFETQQ